MTTFKSIQKVISGSPAIDGAGVHLTRVIGYNDVKDFDPFLLLDSFDSTDPNDYLKGFPWHPHRGIETVTYLISGLVEHGDTLGNKGKIEDGCCQWMTAGSGIIHQEMPKNSPHLLGLQLWINLPRTSKMTDPKYRDILPEQVPVITDDNAIIRIISGEYKNTLGFFKGDFVETLFLDIELKNNSQFSMDIDKENTLFIYIVKGECSFDKNYVRSFQEKSAVLFNNNEKTLFIKTQSGCRVLLFSAKPLKEPIAWGGPIVMNTQSELDTAFEELSNNTFIKFQSPSTF